MSAVNPKKLLSRFKGKKTGKSEESSQQARDDKMEKGSQLLNSMDSGLDDLSFEHGDQETVNDTLESNSGSDNFTSLSSSECSDNEAIESASPCAGEVDDTDSFGDKSAQRNDMSTITAGIITDMIESLDEVSILRKCRYNYKNVNRRSKDMNALLTGFELQTIELEAKGLPYYIHRFQAIDAESIVLQLALRVGDCILRLNHKNAVEMTMDELAKELKFNAEKFDLVIGREDDKEKCGLRAISYGFKIEKSFNQSKSSDRVSQTAHYKIALGESSPYGELDDDLEEDGPNDCYIVGRILKLLSSKVYVIKHGEMHLACHDDRVYFKPEYREDDDSLRFHMKEFKGINVKTITRIYCAVYSASKLGRVLVAQPSEIAYMKDSDVVDGKLDQALNLRAPLCADEGIFTWKRVLEGKYVLESTQHQEHYLCAKNRDFCTIERVSDPASDSRIHFIRFETTTPQQLNGKKQRF